MNRSITCMKNGPLQVRGEIPLIDDNGHFIEDNQEVRYLCRCGASAKKPYCDGAHARPHFTS